jgi:hypothetical protein
VRRTGGLMDVSDPCPEGSEEVLEDLIGKWCFATMGAISTYMLLNYRDEGDGDGSAGTTCARRFPWKKRRCITAMRTKTASCS